jgi:hypothetical protein
MASNDEKIVYLVKVWNRSNYTWKRYPSSKQPEKLKKHHVASYLLLLCKMWYLKYTMQSEVVSWGNKLLHILVTKNPSVKSIFIPNTNAYLLKSLRPSEYINIINNLILLQ